MSAFLKNSNRLGKVILFSSVAFLLTACTVGKNEAIQVSVQVGDTAEGAKAAVLQLKDTHQKQVDAHIATRKLLKDTLEQSFGANNPKVVEGLKQIKATHMARVDTMYADTVSAIRTEKKTALTLLNSKIDEQMKELADKVNGKRQLAIEQKERQKKFPNDTRVELDLKKAQASYLALAAQYFETKYNAYMRGVGALDAAEQDILDKLSAQRVKYRADIEGRYTKALENLPRLTSEDIDLGPEPTVPSGYDVVALSQDSIKKGSDQIITQLQSSGFGKGSIFRGGLNAFAQGLLSGAFASRNGSVTLKDVKASGQNLLSDIKDDLNQNLNDINEGAREAMGNLQEGAVSTLISKVEEAISPVIDAIKPSAT
ncbi:hypothetical protein KFE96_13805 [Kordiimonas sp. SCSIO 12603]|uniref:hypothetical protein n=1 Tax=Kordiimonas sp. SCSIO 12603 TaxID=2829596 RepID=UPI0021066A7F|nr:hypothetical protein [Kordiimonas sp. SCSIO 12603]UTW57892.1 hypothetical protein KFE96_13805 [Kordiimonas sp. SCSIO 12603]